MSEVPNFINALNRHDSFTEDYLKEQFSMLRTTEHNKYGRSKNNNKQIDTEDVTVYLLSSRGLEIIIDKNGDGTIDLTELQEALGLCGFKLANFEVRKIIEDYDSKITETKGKLVFSEFIKLCSDLKDGDISSKFKQAVSKKENVETLSGSSTKSSDGTTHSIRLEEQLAFSDWINSNLGADSDLKHLLPLDSDGKNLYDKVKDGILLCKLINNSCRDTIDERAINKPTNKNNLTIYKKLENLTLALVSSQSIGCNIVNIDADDLEKGNPYLVLGLLWQIIRIGLFNQITLKNCPGLATLLHEGEKIEELLKLSPEAILLRWVNYHLNRAGLLRQCRNFQGDISDSEIYTHLLKQIAPQHSNVDTSALLEPNLKNRAEIMLKQAEKLGCRSFVTSDDVLKGVHKLNLAFVANLFNNHPALDIPVEIVGLESIEETKEEKTYKNWMNSMGVTPYVNWLYSDLVDGLVIFQLYDFIKPGIVNWSRVNRSFSKPRTVFMEKLENCNYAIQLGHELKLSLVGIAGQDLNNGNKTFTLALIWQLMKMYTLSVLTKLTEDTGRPINDKEIVSWVNEKLKNANKISVLKGFQDHSLSDGRIIIDLIDAIRPGTIDYDLVRDSGGIEDNLANAKYAISMARKTGARVYALPDDITEVKPKMVMTVFACLMANDYVPSTTDIDKADE